MRRAALALAGVLAGPALLAGCSSPPSPRAVTGAQLAAAVAAVGGTLTGVVQGSTVVEARITVAVPAGGGAGPTASGWVAWPAARPFGSLVVYGRGCCGVPADWASEVAGVEAVTGTLVVAMDYRLPDAYAPDVAAEDMAAADTVLRAALPGVTRSIAWGQSEGGAATGLLIERHPGLVDTWVDQSGAVDLQGVLDQLGRDEAAGLTGVGALTALARAAVGSPPDPAKVAALSPGARPGALASLRRVVVVHGSGDLVVPVQQSVSLAAALRGQGVATSLRVVDPAAGQPRFDLRWHGAAAVTAQAAAAVRDAIAGRPVGAAVVHATATLG